MARKTKKDPFYSSLQMSRTGKPNFRCQLNLLKARGLTAPLTTLKQFPNDQPWHQEVKIRSLGGGGERNNNNKKPQALESWGPRKRQLQLHLQQKGEVLASPSRPHGTERENHEHKTERVSPQGLAGHRSLPALSEPTGRQPVVPASCVHLRKLQGGDQPS